MKQARYVLVDDVDGSVAEETVVFSVGKHQYEIDLSKSHLSEFNKDLDKWTRHARKVSGRRAKGPSVGAKGDAPLIRAWAVERGIPISDRGRVSAEIREQYYKEAAGA